MEEKCDYQGCKHKMEHTHELALVNEKDANVRLPFCNYHFYIVIGGHFKAKKIEKEEGYDFEIVGPIQEVGIIEQVIAAREIVEKIAEEKK